MKSNLKKCKEELLQKRTDLLNLWYKSQQHKEMLSILETMYGMFMHNMGLHN
jgi:exocyst complex component 4